MRMRAALIVLALACAGCGGARNVETVSTTAKKAAPAPPLGLRVGIAGALDVAPVRGVRFVRGRIATMPALPLVLASAESTKLTDVLAAAQRYPTSHYAYVGGSLSGSRRPNVVGVVLRDDQAVRLGGFVAGLVAAEEGGVSPRVAWVGPEEQKLADAFAAGVHDAAPNVTVLRAFSADAPAACKEAALAAIGRGAVALMAHRGLCADATVAGAHQQNDVGMRTSDFELANVPVGVLVRDAQKGVYHGGEDLVFGAASGAIGVSHLDRRISGEAGVRARTAAQQMANGLRPTG
jgi:basic membrane lipoprotein Med (substrate-binding protein (PBP1-ABC) superfamily)